MTWIEFLLTGQGGQGVVELGNYIAHDAILRGLRAASIPSYGPETRSGKVKCYVITAESTIDYPVAENPDILVVMNDLSMDFEPDLKPHGLLVINSSMVRKQPARRDITLIKVPATDLANELRNEVDPSILEGLLDIRLLANSVIFGALQALQNLSLNINRLNEVYVKAFGESKKRFAPINVKAAVKGHDYITRQKQETINATFPTTSFRFQ